MTFWKKFINRPYWLLAIGVLVLAACAPQGSPQESAPQIETPVAVDIASPTPGEGQPKQLDSGSSPENAADSLSPTAPSPVTAGTEAAGPGMTPAPSEPAGSQPVFSPSDRPLFASDPASFSLASGQIQLVEFFAFW